jgi:outer membrane biosynthesis protein TonB
MISHKKYLLLLMTLFILTSCGREDDSNITSSSSWNSQETSEAPLIQEETPPLPEVPTPQITPIEKVSRPEIIKEVKKETPQKETIPEKEVIPQKEVIQKKVEKPKETSSLTTSKVVRLTQVYNSPGGQDEIGFNVTIEGNKIKDISANTIKAHKVSQNYQDAFANEIGKAVIGKTLWEAENISTVAGASLTTGAFKKALKNM